MNFDGESLCRRIRRSIKERRCRQIQNALTNIQAKQSGSVKNGHGFSLCLAIQSIVKRRKQSKRENQFIRVSPATDSLTGSVKKVSNEWNTLMGWCDFNSPPTNNRQFIVCRTSPLVNQQSWCAPFRLFGRKNVCLAVDTFAAVLLLVTVCYWSFTLLV